jgi:hypothetical protein
MLLVGASTSALFSTDYPRDHLVETLWSGATAQLRWRRFGGWLLGIRTPNRCSFYPDASSERHKLRALEERRG